MWICFYEIFLFGAGAMGGGLEDMGTVFTEMGLDPFG